MSDEHPVELGESEFEELADNAPVMIWRSRPDKLCDWFNKPWCDYSGKGLDELFGFGWAEDVHPEDYDRCVRIYSDAFDARENFTMPYRLRRKDGEYRWFLDNGAPFYRKGIFAGYFGSCIDITEQKEAEDHKETLLAELNHRVKNNLQLIISFIHMSMRKAEGAEAKGLMRDVMNRIQGIGTIHSELHKTGMRRVDLAEYLPNLARAALIALTGSGERLELKVETAHVSIEYASDLGLMINELVTNAIKHSGSDSTVKLSVEKLSADLVKICVADQGGGFDSNLLGSQPIKGSKLHGLGLVEALAQRSKTRINRVNGSGAIVEIEFPA
jgi:PAS domain S-box-containing protein